MKRSILLSIILFLAPPLDAADSQPAQEGLEFTIKSEKEVYNERDDIHIEIRVKNIENKPILFFTGVPRPWVLSFNITAKNTGRKFEQIELGEKLAISKSDFLTLKRNEVYTRTINIASEYTYNVNAPGEYGIFAIYRYETDDFGKRLFGFDNVWKGVLISNVINIKINPQLESSLSRMTDAQVREITNTHASKEGYDLNEYQEPILEYDPETQEWYVFYDQIYVRDPDTGELMGAPGKHFGISVDDKTGGVKRLMRGL